MSRRVTVAVALALIASPGWPQDFTPLGSFADVRSRDGGEHCQGYSLAVWRFGERVLGLLDVHEGLCGDPPCGVIQDGSLDPRTGRLRFWASVGERRDFAGTLDSDAVVGTLGGRPVRLPRARDRAGADFKPNQSLAGWCEFWSGVSRCRGVRELCAALRPSR